MELCSSYEKRNLNLHGLINDKYFFDKFLILKFLFSELELKQFYSSLSSFLQFNVPFNQMLRFLPKVVNCSGGQVTL